MGRQPTTCVQVSGYRFLIRRTEHALVRGDVRMIDDPLRAQTLSLVAGCVLTAVLVAAFGILAYLRPQGTLGDATIVMVRESGALYVRIGDTMHPVLNLASARLIAGAPTDPEAVSASAIAGAKRGPLVGIPGAPAGSGIPLPTDESGWAVCDDSSSTTVIAGLSDRIAGFASGAGILVTPRSEGAAITYLLFDGWRARVDLRNRAVVRALRLDGVKPRPVSRVLLDSIPEAPALTAPQIPSLGSPGPLPEFTVGTVLRVNRAATAEYYVVLAQGVQRIGEVAADLIRFTNSQNGPRIVTVTPDAIGEVPIVNALSLRVFPEHAGIAEEAVVCAYWRPAGRSSTAAVLLGDSFTGGAGMSSVTLAQADGEGPNVDAVSIPSGRNAYVRSTGIVWRGERTGPLHLVDDSGVVFGLHDEAAASYLGLTSAPAVAPWPILAALPRGPELSKDAASVTRDSLAGAP